LNARPGSSLWLLKHEVRMFFYNQQSQVSKAAANRGMARRTIALFAAMWIAIHAFAFAILSPLEGASAPAALPAFITVIFAAALSMMISGGLTASVKALFERSDLDLLLSSPLPSRSIFVVRLAGITIGVAGIYLFILAPFANVGLVLGQFHWLSIYPVVMGAAVLAASLSMLLTLGLVRLIGVRKTRTVAQVLGALSGAFIFLASQGYSTFGAGLRQQLGGWMAPLLAPGALLGPDSMAWLPGRAILGAPLPLLGFCIVTTAAFGFTAAFTHRFFVHGAQQAISVVRVAAAPPGGPRFRFDRSLAQAVVIKEWRLILRDPHLISQVLLQLLYMAPLGFALLFNPGRPLASIGAALTFLCASLTASLTWVIISAEEAPDLLRAAPCRLETIKRAKVAAVALPAPLIVALPLLWAAARSPVAALLTGLAVAAAVASSAQIAMWCGRPAKRGDFKRRGNADVAATLIEALSGGAWAGVAYVMLSMNAERRVSAGFAIGAASLFGAALLALWLGWLRRDRDR
jgi:ABC-2 type transport system permease protein